MKFYACELVDPEHLTDRRLFLSGSPAQLRRDIEARFSLWNVMLEAHHDGDGNLSGWSIKIKWRAGKTRASYPIKVFSYD